MTCVACVLCTVQVYTIAQCRILLGVQQKFSKAKGVSGQMKMENMLKVVDGWE